MYRKFYLLTSTVAFALVGLFMTSSADAIERGVMEFGVDGTVAVTDFEFRSTLTQIVLPDRIRFGVFITERVSLDFLMSFIGVNQGGGRGTDLGFAIRFGPGIHFSEKQHGTIGYVEPTVAVAFVKTGSNTISQFDTGAEVGFKVVSSSGLAARVGVFVTRAFENSDAGGATTFGVNFGMSFLNINK